MIGIAAEFSALPPVAAPWDSEEWGRASVNVLAHHMGSRPSHFPRTSFRVGYDRDAVSVIFHVEDRFVRAVAAQDQDAVWEDSCVEFFFSPGNDVENGYFNLEMNCGGTILLHFQPAPRKGRMPFSSGECARVERAHTLPKLVEPEITAAVTWTVCCRLPVDLLLSYRPVARPRSGVCWRANFHKCADRSSHPHWLTWAEIDAKAPDFHRPDSFGLLRFS